MASEEYDAQTKAAEELKLQGNAFFKDKRWSKAKEYYSKAIEAGGEKLAVYYNNRATVEYKLENYGAAEMDATAALEGGFYKGYYRRGQTRVSLNKLKDAIKDFKKALKYFPSNKDCKRALKQTKKKSRDIAFARAIETTHTAPMSERIPLDQWTIPASYNGPVVPDEITLEWVKEVIEFFRSEKILNPLVAAQILLRVLEIFRQYDSVVFLDHNPEADTKKYNVCGDTHGQFYDLIHIFEVAGEPSPENPFIFNGDFVDRGSFSCEVILTLFCWKLLYPNYFHLTRGNHETVAMTSMYGFQGECEHKYNKQLQELFQEVFNYLPLGIVLGEQVLVVHGGIPKEEGVTLEDLRIIDRVHQPPNTGYMCDLVWADPQPMNGFSPSKRGVSFHFGPDISHRFLDSNHLKYLVRSHEMKEEGYEVCHDGRVITIFSAPNYCDSMGNKGAFIVFDEDWEPTFEQFVAQPHPNVRPMQYAQMGNFL